MSSVMMGGLLFGLFVVGVRLGVGVSRIVFLGYMGSIEDKDTGGGDAAAIGLFDLEGGSEMEGGNGVVEDLGGESGVEESAEKHVSADAGKAIEVGDAHGLIVSCARRAAGQGTGDCGAAGGGFAGLENCVAW